MEEEEEGSRTERETTRMVEFGELESSRSTERVMKEWRELWSKRRWVSGSRGEPGRADSRESRKDLLVHFEQLDLVESVILRDDRATRETRIPCEVERKGQPSSQSSNSIAETHTPSSPRRSKSCPTPAPS